MISSQELPRGHCFEGSTLLGFNTFEFNKFFLNTTQFQRFCIQHLLYSTLLLFNTPEHTRSERQSFPCPFCGTQVTRVRILTLVTWVTQNRQGKLHLSLRGNLFIYQARESLAWSQQCFWQPIFCRKHILWSLCFDWRTTVKCLCIASMEKRKRGDKSIFHPFSYLMLPLSSRKAVNRSTTRFPQSKQRLHKLRFLQKLDCQKPCWDQARLCLAW